MAGYELRLLERIKNQNENPERHWSRDPELVKQSIMSHLQRILNSKQGSVPIADDYGMPDFTDLASRFTKNTKAELLDIVTQVVKKFEPRLRNVRMVAETMGDDYMNLRFKLEGSVDLDQAEVPVMLSTILDADGKIKVER